MLERDASSAATLLGFLIRERDTPGPLLEVSPGMSVLYGLNGAGKSRILDDIRRFFRGVSSDAIALIRLSPVHGRIDWNRELDSGDWFPDWARRADITFGDHEEILRGWAGASLSAEAVAMPGVPQTSSVHRSDRLRALISEWVEHPLILVKAVGSSERSSWASAPGFCTETNTPSTNDEVELFEVWDLLDPDLHDGFAEIALTPYGRTAEGKTIACASHQGQSILEDDAIPFSAGIHDRLINLTPTITSSSDDIDAQTRRHLLDHVTELIDIIDGNPQASAALAGYTNELAALANKHFKDVLQDAPSLGLHVNPIGLGQQVHWYVEEDCGQEDPAPVPRTITVPAEELPYVRTLAGLSTAQHRWARWSIAMALNLMNQPTSGIAGPEASQLYLLDEPEAALHRSAEAQMADYFTQLARSTETHMIVATHSPELLETATARVYEVSRPREGWRLLQVLDSATRENMTALGLQPSDLLRRQRGLVLVEGLHDEVVLEELFGEEMRRLRVETLPLRGTTELSPAKISFLFDYTPAHVFLMLDNVQTDELASVWERSLAYLREGEDSEAEALVSNATCLATTDEGKKLKKVLLEILLNNRAHRVTPFGLSRGDIVEYLPIGALVRTEGTWEQLRLLHAQRKIAAPGSKTPNDFKKWLERDHEGDFEVDAIRAAIRRLDALPPDLLRLWKTIEAHISA